MVSDEQIAAIRGEALAGRLLARMTLQVVAQLSPDARQLLDSLSRHADGSLNISTAVTDGDPELDNLALEVARIRIQEDLATIKKAITKP